MNMCCPTCGHALASASPAVLRDMHLPPQMRTIVDVLVAAYPRQVSVQRLIEALYGDRPDGGPDNPEGVLKTRISAIRKVVEAAGWTIPRHGYGESGRYRLEKIED